MKQFEKVTFDAAQCRRELDEFRELLASQSLLPERNTIIPFLKKRRQLSAFIGTYFTDVGSAVSLLAYEWSIRGDFAADIVVGNEKTRTFAMVELEEGGDESIFTKSGIRSTKEWGRRFEHGFSQLVDWFFALDDLSHTHDFQDDFGPGHVKFHGLLVIGRSADISDSDRRRLRWREERVVINSHPIHCISYDELYEKLSQRLAVYEAAAGFGE